MLINWAICHGISLFFITFLIIDVVNGRWLEVGMFPTSTISEGVANKFHENTSDLHMMVSNSSESTTMLYAQKRCHSIYGFLPCADTVQEGVVLMLIYTYLMMLGEEWIDKGSPALFGDGALGASVFRVLKALPKIVIIIVSGVLATTSDAQHKVAFAVSFYAGSTVITLTLIWGLHIILYRDKLRGKVSAQKSDDKQHSSVRQNSSVRQKLSVLCDTGVNIDKETGILAVIMLLSLIPFATVELVLIFNSRIIILLALIVSGVSLVLYFAYQIYSGLVMDNLMGLATLLATVYIKGLSWRYKAEVVTIMMPCTIVGLFSLRRDTYPLWASLCAILLYPISIYVHYVLH
ncbi:hypothetical protein L2E82_31130 [Cichorium intybus]|uniref:Uncharacterized protein n=1 Tax=Cichorium intybus TaxID=13427 RepID=A0ACB9D2J8_CICIN|nr:hypothetical protein L2E82_31130 [Cichorium intybus]